MADIPAKDYTVVQLEYAWMHKKVNFNFSPTTVYTPAAWGPDFRLLHLHISKGGGLTPIIIVRGKK
ncbi:MAG: hypothetical protein ACYTFG_13915 [Planctomycetota bacterium]